MPEDEETTRAVELPEDLVEEILHRIKAEFLLRWKSVSKGWKSLIESGHLAEKHLRHREKLYGANEYKITYRGSNSRGFLRKIWSKNEHARTDKRESEVLPRVPGSCTGLVCVYDLDFVNLFNPITRVSRTLSPPQGTRLSVGFGRDVVTGAYKVAVVYSLYDDRVETIVFDLSTSEWRRRHKTAGPMPLSFTQFRKQKNPVFVNGSLFWLLPRDHSEILVMDLHTEKFRTVSHHKDIDVSESLFMWSLEDRLCVSELKQRWASDVWVLVQDELSDRWERTKLASYTVIPPLKLNAAWFSPTLVSPYQSS